MAITAQDTKLKPGYKQTEVGVILDVEGREVTLTHLYVEQRTRKCGYAYLKELGL